MRREASSGFWFVVFGGAGLAGRAEEGESSDWQMQGRSRGQAVACGAGDHVCVFVLARPRTVAGGVVGHWRVGSIPQKGLKGDRLRGMWCACCVCVLPEARGAMKDFWERYGERVVREVMTFISCLISRWL